MSLFLNPSKENSNGSAVVSFALVAPLVMLVAYSAMQLIFLIMTYANSSLAADRGARYLSMGMSPLKVIEKTSEELKILNFYKLDPNIKVELINLSDTNLKIVTISIPISLGLGIKFNLVTSSYAV